VLRVLCRAPFVNKEAFPMRKNVFLTPAILLVGFTIPFAFASAACSSDTTTTTTTNDGGTSEGGADTGTDSGGRDDSGNVDAGLAGGPVTGAQDSHCGSTVQATSAASCHADAGAPPDDAGADDAGDAGDAGAVCNPYCATMFDAEGDDDDCKYHVKWTSTPIRQSANVTFTVTATNKTDKSPLTPPAGYATGDPIRAEVYLTDTHPAPNSGEKGAATSTPGTYTAGPIRFDQPGRWTVRFHFFEDCVDGVDDSPHGHAAFFVDVP
jgi:hypothetical protein